MNPTTFALSPWQRRLVYLGMIVPIGFLSADAFAQAAGFPSTEPPHQEAGIIMRIVGGVAVALAALAVLVLLRHVIAQILDYLGNVTAKPQLPVAITLLVCGTLCILGMLVFEYRVVTQASSFAAAALAQMTESGAVSFTVRVPVFAHVIAACAFLAGAALLALGVWSSVDGRVMPVMAPAIEPERRWANPPEQRT